MAGGHGFRADSLAAQRLAAGHSITRLAQLANVSDSTIKTLENGGTDTEAVVRQLAAALGIDTATIGMVSICS